MSKPKHWPSDLPYLTRPLHSKDILPAHLSNLSTRPPHPPNASSSAPLQTISHLPSPLVKILPIADPAHPAYGQCGLFAAQCLKPGSFILPYLGRVHTSKTTDPSSDYDLWLDRDADVAVDASREGNEARFVNDYRGVADRPNAEFAEVWCEKWSQMVIGVWVIKDGRKDAVKGIKKGQEILVSYGKGFWEGRTGGGHDDGSVA